MSSSKKPSIICGIDEAGRGPVIGPLILCGVCFEESQLPFLKKIGVRDSKKLSPKRRKELAKTIKDNCLSFEIISVSAKEIDKRKTAKITLNRLEELKMSDIINKLRPDVIYIDAVDVNEERFGKSIERLLNYSPNKIVSKHKADDLFPIVSAASIIAKDTRDDVIDKFKQKYSDIGSGYPSDKRTTDFLRNWIKKNKNFPPFVRISWETTKKILDQEVKNKKITDYFN
ncbi:MAG: ribonuclease HII [Promethearchaeota archaeon]